jgi:hypothetical protein
MIFWKARSAKPACCAQNNDRPFARTADRPASQCFRSKPKHCSDHLLRVFFTFLFRRRGQHANQAAVDELGEMAASVKAFKEAAIHKLRIEEEGECARSILAEEWAAREVALKGQMLRSTARSMRLSKVLSSSGRAA